MRIYTHASALTHEVPPGHPERPERLHALLAHLKACGLTQDAPLAAAPAATAEQVLRVHPDAYLAMLERQRPESGHVALDPDTWMSPDSLTAALDAAGSVCGAVRDVMNGEETRVFCAVRPPGHHAERATAMGFCLLNSIAIGALAALEQFALQRVAILDFDVHHGNGSVAAFVDDPRVLVCSSFQHPHYPNRLFDVDAPNIVNTPLAAGTGGEVFRRAVEETWLPALQQHQPQLILLSAGFDAHRLDPLANINLVEDDFAWVTQLAVDQARETAQGRVVSVLEGGYDLTALASSAEAHLEALRD